MLGLAHPRVHAFTEELKILQSLVGSTADTTADHEINVHTPESNEPALERTQNPEQTLQHQFEDQLSTASRGIIASEQIDTETADYSTAQAQQALNELDNKPDLPKLTTSLPSPNQKTSPVEAAVVNGVPLDGIWNTWRPPHKSPSIYRTLPAFAFDGIARGAVNALQWLQANYGPERPLEPGKARVRWTCSCGEQLHDDFVERKPGAARRLEALLNRPRTHAPANGSSPTSPSSSQATNSFASSSFGFPPSSQTSWSSFSTQGQNSLRGNGGSKHQATSSTLSIPSQYHPFYEPPWLLTCANEDRYTPKLAHLDMAPHKITSDKDLAKSLREHYYNVNKKWFRSLRIRGLQSIEFVQLEVHQNR